MQHFHCIGRCVACCDSSSSTQHLAISIFVECTRKLLRLCLLRLLRMVEYCVFLFFFFWRTCLIFWRCWAYSNILVPGQTGKTAFCNKFMLLLTFFTLISCAFKGGIKRPSSVNNFAAVRKKVWVGQNEGELVFQDYGWEWPKPSEELILQIWTLWIYCSVCLRRLLFVTNIVENVFGQLLLDSLRPERCSGRYVVRSMRRN